MGCDRVKAVTLLLKKNPYILRTDLADKDPFVSENVMLLIADALGQFFTPLMELVCQVPSPTKPRGTAPSFSFHTPICVSVCLC